MGRLLLFFFWFIALTSQNVLESVQSYSCEKKPLRDVFVQLLDPIDLNYILPQQIDVSTQITFTAKDQPLKQILEQLCQPYRMSYSYNHVSNLLSFQVLPLRVTGTVFDEHLKPIPEVSIYVEPLNTFIETDINGKFELRNTNHFTLRFSFKHIAYIDSTITIQRHQMSENLKFQLTTKTFHSTPQHILSSSTPFEHHFSQGITTLRFINPKLPSSGTPDALKALELIPGITGTENGSTKFESRGNSYDQNQLLFDLIPIYHSGALNGYYSIFNPDVLKSMAVHRGVYSPRYGGKLSSIIEMDGKSAAFDRFRGNITLNTISTGANLEIPLTQNSSLVIGARKTISDQLKSALYKKIKTMMISTDESYTSDSLTVDYTPDFEFFDLYGKYSYQLSAKHSFELSYLKSQDSQLKKFHYTILEDDGVEEIDEDQITTFQNEGVSFVSEHFWSKALTSEHNVTISRYNYNSSYEDIIIEDSISVIPYKEQSAIKESLVTNHFNWTIFTPLDVVFGLNFRQFEIGSLFHDANNQNNLLETNDQFSEYSYYISGRYAFETNTLLQLGFRQNYSPEDQIFYFEPRTRITQKLTPELHTNISYGVFHQSLHRIRLDSYNRANEEHWFISNNEEIPVSYTNKYQWETEWRTEQLRTLFTVYYNQQQNLINYHKFLPTKYPFFLISNGTTTGFEMSLQKRFFNIETITSYSKTWIDIPIKAAQFTMPFQTVDESFKLTNIYQTKGWTLKSHLYLKNGLTYQDEVFDFNTEYQPEEPFQLHKLPLIHKWDLSVTKALFWRTFGINLNLTLINITNTRPTVKKEMNPFIEDQFNNVRMMGFTPTFSIDIQFDTQR